MYLQKVRPHFLKFVLAGLLLVSLYSTVRQRLRGLPNE